MSKINLNTITFEAYSKLILLDKSFVGTPNYMGLAYFWNYEYRHYLRGMSMYRLRLVHKKGLAENVDFLEVGNRQWDIIKYHWEKDKKRKGDSNES